MSGWGAAVCSHTHMSHTCRLCRARDIAFLQRVTLFSHWPPDRLRKLAERATDVTFGPDEVTSIEFTQVMDWLTIARSHRLSSSKAHRLQSCSSSRLGSCGSCAVSLYMMKMVWRRR